jgi:hypothetical protein
MRYSFNAMKFLELPIEIQDMIFLQCDSYLLENTRDFQSDYIKKSTQFFSFNNVLNKFNLQWLFNSSVRWGIYMHDRVFLLACINSDISIIKFIWKPSIKFYNQHNGFNSIVSQGNLENVKRLYNLGVEYNKEQCINMSRKKGYNDITEFLLQIKK